MLLWLRENLESITISTSYPSSLWKAGIKITDFHEELDIVSKTYKIILLFLKWEDALHLPPTLPPSPKQENPYLWSRDSNRSWGPFGSRCTWWSWWESSVETMLRRLRRILNSKHMHFLLLFYFISQWVRAIDWPHDCSIWVLHHAMDSWTPIS